MNLLLLIGGAFLLLVTGVLLGRYYTPDRRPLERAAEEGRAYIRGLIEVLDGDNDAAIREITEALKRNTTSVEAYFALGTLFRNRQEYERAVRVHQAVLARRDLDKRTRLRVHYQLASDFRAAGFPRRAIQALEWIVGQDRKHLQALQSLAPLYEEAGEWERAAAVYRRIGDLGGQQTASPQAHLYAALANRLLEENNLRGARKQIRRALAADAQSVHALHVLALYQQRRGDLPAAARVWERALQMRPNLAGYFLPRLEAVLFETQRLERIDTLFDELMKQHPGHVHVRLAYARFDARRNPERALAQLSAVLDEAPNLLPARREAARLVLASGDEARIRAAFEDLLELLQRADRSYRCAGCGHTAEELFWRCPKCGSWDSVGVAWGRRSGEGPAAKKSVEAA